MLLLPKRFASLLVALCAACAREDTRVTDETGAASGDAGSTSESTTSAGLTTEEPTTGSATTATTGGGVRCIETRVPLTFEGPTPFGASSAELLEEKFGPRVTMLFFGGGFIDPVSDMWSGAMLPLAVELRYEGGMIHWVDAEAEEDSGSKDEIPCIDRIEVEMTLDFVTEQGEFDEHRTALAVLPESQILQVSIDFVPPGLTGSLDLTTIFSDPDWVIESLSFIGTWRGKEAGGRVMRTAVVGDTTNTALLARWGDKSLHDPPDGP